MRVPDFKQIVNFGANFYRGLGNKTILRHIQHILSGNDVRGKKFLPYNKHYAKKKGVGVNDVNLRLTGKMLNSIKLGKVTEQGFKYAMKGKKQQDKMNAHISGDYGTKSLKPRVTSDKEDPIPQKVQEFVALEIARKVARKIQETVDGQVVIRV